MNILNPREGDFKTAFPKYLVICTDLPASSLSGDEGKYWILANRNVVVGTFLGMNSRAEIETHMARMEGAGLNILVCADCSPADIMSGMVDLEALKLVSIADKVSVQDLDYRPVVIMQKDIFNKTGVVRYCWFF